MLKINRRSFLLGSRRAVNGMHDTTADSGSANCHPFIGSTSTRTRANMALRKA